MPLLHPARSITRVVVLSGLTKVCSVVDEYADDKAWINLVLDEWSHPCPNAYPFVL